MRVVVFGGSGFVGSAVVEALSRRGNEAVAAKTPRIEADKSSQIENALADARALMTSADAAVNAAGVSDAVGATDALTLANGILPGVIASAAEQAGVRLVHVSSAAVQGDVDVLDDSMTTRPFSPYSRSKAEGERRVLAARDQGAPTIVYRPPGVHHPSRRVTRRLVSLAASPFSTVAGSGARPTAQALLENVADAVAFLATCEQLPPPVVHQPSEDLTTAGLLQALGGRSPRRVPERLARAVVAGLKRVRRIRPGLGGQARRIEMLWFGQDQAPSWLEEAGWTPVLLKEHWTVIGQTLRFKENTHD